ncbi:hypothetical protein EUTSA_v10012015mg [Eutrema salsugineum]|uniref:MATH domain-containing protein n=2 Tax=Eutrema salsugineum TaxID=72664 RepID=V4KTX8_EUTSA|nr:MATH domain and coiled-coil domain-containing protein At2g05410 isoform X1 [Eutrema salsugineum]ESQ30823.1 hypothetical protein EUTSA_v10012015mg [Eutrema salsugineum]
MENQTDKKFIWVSWVIKNFSSLKSENVYSHQFEVGSCKWRLAAYPKGYNKDNHFCLYLHVADSEILPIGWKRHAKFSFTIVNQFSDKLSKLRESQKWFDQKSPSWGFPQMITLTEHNAKEGFLVNDELIIVAKVDVLEVVGKLDVSEESSPVNDTIYVKGFQVLPSQVESVNRLFEKHQDIASKFRPKNPFLKTAYMSLLLSLTQVLCQSPQKISEDDLAEQYAALAYLTDAGFELGWLEKKLDEVKEKKSKEEACLARLQEMEEQLKPLKQKCSVVEADMDKGKVELLAARAPVSLYDDDVV